MAPSESIPQDLIELPPGAPNRVLGRPLTLTDKILDEICHLVSLGFSKAQAAAHLGISRSAVTKAMQRNPPFAAAIQRAEDVSDLQPQVTILAEARKNWRAAAWLLQFKAKHHRKTVTQEDRDLDHEEDLEKIRRGNQVIDAAMRMEMPTEAKNKSRRR